MAQVRGQNQFGFHQRKEQAGNYHQRDLREDLPASAFH